MSNFIGYVKKSIILRSFQPKIYICNFWNKKTGKIINISLGLPIWKSKLENIRGISEKFVYWFYKKSSSVYSYIATIQITSFWKKYNYSSRRSIFFLRKTTKAKGYCSSHAQIGTECSQYLYLWHPIPSLPTALPRL